MQFSKENLEKTNCHENYVGTMDAHRLVGARLVEHDGVQESCDTFCLDWGSGGLVPK